MPSNSLAAACAQLPLALRIAAADHLADPSGVSLGEYVDDLAEDRLGKLAVGSTDPATAVKSVLDRSYRNLTPDARRALRLLSCHPGTDWDRSAAASLLDLDSDAAEHQLDELRDHSLLDTFDAPAGQRFRMHDLTTEYARTHPDSDTRHWEQALQRLWDHYRRSAGLAMDHFAPQDKHLRPESPTLPGPVPELSDLPQATTWLDTERVNLLTAAKYCAENGDSAVVRDLAAAIFRYLEQQGHWRDGIMLHQLECEHTDDADKHHALHRLGCMHQRLSSPTVARELFERALDLARQARDAVGEIQALNSLGIACQRLGLFQDAIDRYRQAAEAARVEGNDVLLGRALVNISVVHTYRGEYELAAEHCQQALAAARASGTRSSELYTLNNLGTVYEAQGNLSAAADHYRRGLELAREIGSRIVERTCLSGLGCVSELNGQFEEALRYHSDALRLTDQIDDQAGRAGVLNDLSVTLRRLGRLDEASGHAREALTSATVVDHLFGEARANDNIAQTLAAQGDSTAARRHWTEALRIFEELDTPEAQDVKRQLAELPEPAGD